MKYLIVGLGNQGRKRAKFIEKKNFIFFDPFIKSSKKSLEKVPKNDYQNVLLCCPDKEKVKLIKYFIKFKKNILVEKPLIFSNQKEISEIKTLLQKNKVILYTAYNHRFEPGLIHIKKNLKKFKLGKYYHLKIFYGNGTAKLVKKSPWKDKFNGILFDLGSHLIDILLFLFKENPKNIEVISKNKFENKFDDYIIFKIKLKKLSVFCEMTYCMWKNSFSLDFIGQKGSIHMNSLCKWSESTLSFLKRKYPSGYPNEKKIIFKKGDPTWELEHLFFERLVKNKDYRFSLKNLQKDKLIYDLLSNAKK